MICHQSSVNRIARILENGVQYAFHRSQASGLFQRHGIRKVQHAGSTIQGDVVRPGLQTSDRVDQPSLFDDQDGVSGGVSDVYRVVCSDGNSGWRP